MEITRYRGDNKPFKFNIYSDKTAGTRLDITGMTFKFTVNSEKDPVDTTNQKFSLDGVITNGLSGEVEFRPTKANMDLPKGKLYFDVQVTDGSGYDDTLVKDVLIINQDLTK